MTMTNEELSVIEARALAAPRGHEVDHPDDMLGRSIVSCGGEVRLPYDYTVVGVEGPARVAVAELYGHAQEDILALVAEVRRLRAIVEGRPTSPTTAEARAVKNAGGCFVRTTTGRVRGYSRCVSGLARLGSKAEDQRHSGNARWFVVDRDGRPCAWPEVSK